MAFMRYCSWINNLNFEIIISFFHLQLSTMDKTVNINTSQLWFIVAISTELVKIYPGALIDLII